MKKTQVAVNLTPIPLESAEMYAVSAPREAMDSGLRAVRLQWQAATEHIEHPPILLVFPDGYDFAKVPSDILESMIDKMQAVLDKRSAVAHQAPAQ